MLSGIVYSKDIEHKSTEISQLELAEMVENGFKEIQTGNTSNAINKYLNPVIEYYESKNFGKKVYCARTRSESLLYMLQAANDKKEAMVIEPIWAQAYFLKGYASLDLGRQAEAMKWVNKALELSPANSGYNSELAHLYQLEMKWKESIELFKKAEEYANSTSPESVKNIELLRAKRGIAYVLVEQGNLEEAKKLYNECLAIDPNDEKSKNEMKYIQKLELRKSGKSS